MYFCRVPPEDSMEQGPLPATQIDSVNQSVLPAENATNMESAAQNYSVGLVGEVKALKALSKTNEERIDLLEAEVTLRRYVVSQEPDQPLNKSFAWCWPPLSSYVKRYLQMRGWTSTDNNLSEVLI